MNKNKTIEKIKKRNKKQNEHIKNNYKRVSVVIKNDVYQRITSIYGDDISMNGFINELIVADLEIKEQSKGPVKIEEVINDLPDFMKY